MGRRVREGSPVKHSRLLEIAAAARALHALLHTRSGGPGAEIQLISRDDELAAVLRERLQHLYTALADVPRAARANRPVTTRNQVHTRYPGARHDVVTVIDTQLDAMRALEAGRVAKGIRMVDIPVRSGHGTYHRWLTGSQPQLQGFINVAKAFGYRVVLVPEELEPHCIQVGELPAKEG